MAAIFAQVRGDAVRASVFTQRGRRDGIWLVATPRLTHRRDVIDVDVESLPHSGTSETHQERIRNDLSLAFQLPHPLGSLHRPRGEAPERVKKLAVVLLLVAASCRRTVTVASPPTAGQPGAVSPRAAIAKFMASAKAQDLQAMALIWGSA